MRGLPPAKLDQCLANQAEADKLVQMQSDATSTYDIQGTPAFLVNGEVLTVEPGSSPWEQVEAKLREEIG
jgi:protein-disulfide isomerase